MATTTHNDRSPSAGKLEIRERSNNKRIMSDENLPRGRRYIDAIYWVVGILLFGLALGWYLYHTRFGA